LKRKINETCAENQFQRRRSKTTSRSWSRTVWISAENRTHVQSLVTSKTRSFSSRRDRACWADSYRPLLHWNKCPKQD